MRVCAGTKTGFHVQSAGFIVHGSELYIKMGIFQSSASARTNDLPTRRPVGQVQPQLWVPSAIIRL